MNRIWPLACSALLGSCGPKTLTLPDQLIDRAATCGVVAAAEARAASKDIKAPLPLEAMGRVLHYPLLAGSAGTNFEPDSATAVQKRMSDLQNQITEGKWQQLVPACRAAFPATAVTDVQLPDDRFQAQLGCDELADFVRSALQEQGSYDEELRAYRQLSEKLDVPLGAGLRSHMGSDLKRQQEARSKALAAMAKVGPPVQVMEQCLKKFG